MFFCDDDEEEEEDELLEAELPDEFPEDEERDELEDEPPPEDCDLKDGAERDSAGAERTEGVGAETDRGAADSLGEALPLLALPADCDGMLHCGLGELAGAAGFAISCHLGDG